MKVVIDEGPYGFSLSEEAMGLLIERCKKIDPSYVYEDNGYLRTNRTLIEIIEELGITRAGGRNSNLKVIDIPDEYRGNIHCEHFGEYEVFEELYLAANEKYLRTIIQDGNEDKIVEYVMKIGQRVY